MSMFDKFAIFLTSLAMGTIAGGYDFAQSFSDDRYVINRYGFLYLKESVLTKNDQTVYLIGMIHIGDESYYQQIKEDYKNVTGVILSEGIVNDDNSLDEFDSYKLMAKTISISIQPGVHELFPGKVIKKADVNASDIKKKCISHIVRASKNDVRSEAGVTENDRAICTPEILLKRNDHLYSVIGKTLKTEKRIIVPWGARHLPDIENRLVRDGFRVTRASNRLAMNGHRAFLNTITTVLKGKF